MNSSVTEVQVPTARHVVVTDDALAIDLTDGRTLSVPLAWYPRLWHGTSEERGRWRLIGEGRGIHWLDLDEDISVEGLLLGRRSGESQRSLKHWLEARSSTPTQNEPEQDAKADPPAAVDDLRDPD
jgi:hypothetical protein